jgi:hypothetical protein
MSLSVAFASAINLASRAGGAGSMPSQAMSLAEALTSLAKAVYVIPG